jgi:hypothetical protein
MAEMPLARERDDEFELFQHGLLSQEDRARARGHSVNSASSIGAWL